ncbi:MAG: hypothetical protein E5V92_02715 [Mesorhizobium sp.]|uniref:hypothetical protein n=1 Tax=unclassified Mesorhizobium TaxID=325217 RepID=UPI000F756659|nr:MULTISPECIES: hypothetical protein [unclassified Mesorhizobium]AZO70229.1 hypothetical protein EJ067_02785 [Mesorhizobium sp. M1D.F.Ca.ET.043.01.1.1]RWA92620.1 MAG: hypothetical protein EOQ32_15095 [Mesorhizobium sp.]RWE05658.1 MAG: hypothetical protein EOS61_22005 [Mesorhizobium sp.]TJW89969.1 MAG: hypothetical protein E5V92_02715 [Mesorhizobium sp.]
MKTAPFGFKIRQYYVAKLKRNKVGLLYEIGNHKACCCLHSLGRLFGMTRNADYERFSFAETILTSLSQLKLGASCDKKKPLNLKQP